MGGICWGVEVEDPGRNMGRSGCRGFHCVSMLHKHFAPSVGIFGIHVLGTPKLVELGRIITQGCTLTRFSLLHIPEWFIKTCLKTLLLTKTLSQSMSVENKIKTVLSRMENFLQYVVRLLDNLIKSGFLILDQVKAVKTFYNCFF